MPQITIKDLSFTYPMAENPALRDVNLEIKSGEFILLCGESGSGKSTLLRIIKKELRPHGEYTGDVETTAVNTGFVFQDPYDQAVSEKVWHELAFSLENAGIDRDAMRLRVSEMSAFMGIEDLFRREISTLSGGQLQMINLASVLTLSPEVIILDEPSAQLDPISAEELFSALKRLNRDYGITVIISEHRLDNLFSYADRVLVLEKGRVVCDLPPDECAKKLCDTEHPMAEALPVYMRIGALLKRDKIPKDVREGRELIKSLSLKGVAERETKANQNPISIKAKNVYFSYEKGGKEILNDFDIQIRKGEIYAILGANGAGKTTALGVLSGVLKKTSGKVELSGKAVYLPQRVKSIFCEQSVRLELSALGDEERREEIIKTLSLESILNKHPYDLSGGEQMRVALALCLLSDADIIFLDEPTKGLDAMSKRRFAKLLEDFAGNGKTVVLVSHDIEFCAEYTTRCGMLFDGRIITEDTPHSFFGAMDFYTTLTRRLTRGIIDRVITATDLENTLKGEKEI